MIPLSGGRRFTSNRRSMPPGVSSATRDPVDRVGRQRDDPAATQDLDRLPRRPRRRARPRHDSTRRHAGAAAALRPRRRPRRQPPRPPPIARAGSASDELPRSSAPRPRPRAAARCSGPPPGPPPARVGIAAPCPTSAIISRSFHWSPIASVAPSGTASRRASQRIARPLDTPGRDELEEPRMARSSRRRRPANSARAPAARARSGSGGSPTARTFVTGWPIDADEVGRRARRGRP